MKMENVIEMQNFKRDSEVPFLSLTQDSIKPVKE